MRLQLGRNVSDSAELSRKLSKVLAFSGTIPWYDISYDIIKQYDIIRVLAFLALFS
jgi:hypothetical protein